MNITDKKQKRAVLLHLAGAEVQMVSETLSGTREDYNMALAKLNAYFEPKKNIPFERHAFRQAAQQQSEGMDAFVTRLRGLAKTCEFDDVDEMIRDQVIDKCALNKLCRRLLHETDLKLDGLLDIIRSIETSNLHANTMEANSEQPGQQLNQISTESQGPDHRKRNKNRKNSKHSSGKGKDTKQVVCFCCGHAGNRAKDPSCPANGKTCSACGKQGHFAGACKSTPKATKDAIPRSATPQRNGLRYVTTKPEISDDEYLFAIGENIEATTVPVTVGSTSIPVIIDSGASVNVLDSATFNKLMDNGFVLRNSSVKIYPYGSETPLPVKGTFSAKVSMQLLHTLCGCGEFQRGISSGQENHERAWFATSCT